MKLLIVSCILEEYCNSSSLCVQLLCKGFLQNGHTVVLATPYPNVNNKYYRDDYKFENEHLQHIRYGVKSKKYDTNDLNNKKTKNFSNFLLKIYRKFDLFGRSIRCLKFVPKVYGLIKDMEYSIDVVISTSDPKTSHLFANRLLKYFKDKPYYIQYWGDPLLLDITQKSLLPKVVKKQIERAILEKAERIIYVSPATLDEQQKLFPDLSANMVYIPTPCEETYYKKVGGVVLGYFGSYQSSVRNIMPLYNAVKNKKGVYLYLVGDSDLTLSKQENICVVDRVSPVELQNYYDKCNVFVVLTNKYGSQIPAKIFRDAGSNREVLVVYEKGDGEVIKDYFSSFNRFSFVENSEQAISAVLEKYLLNGVPDRMPEKAFLFGDVSKTMLRDKELE